MYSIICKRTCALALVALLPTGCGPKTPPTPHKDLEPITLHLGVAFDDGAPLLNQ